MSRKEDNRDYVYLIWKDPETRRNYIIGELSANGQYEFSYGHEIETAIKNGFEPLISFADIKKLYKSDTLFPTFKSRIPDRKRRGIEEILSKYGLKEYNAYKLLKRSGARLPIDNLEFIDPIFEGSNGNVKRKFYIAGTRHYIGCEGAQCEDAVDLKVEEQLELVLEPENQYDKNAIKIIDSRENLLGYVPRYYSKGVTEFLKQGNSYKCTVLEVNKDNDCQECIKVKLEIYADEEGYKKIS